MLTITSSQNPRLKKAIALSSSRGRKQQNRFLVFGEREVQRLVASNLEVDEVFLMFDGGEPPQSLVPDWLGASLPEQQCVAIEKSLFTKLAFGDRTDNVAATVLRPDKSTSSLELEKGGFYLVLDRIEKPGNLGAIFRSADGAGVNGVLISDPLTDPFHPNAIRASMGAVFSKPFAIGSVTEMTTLLNEAGFETFVARPDSSRSYTNLALAKNSTAIVLGNESTGVGVGWDHFPSVGLPMLGISDSLNVSNTAAIISYEFRRQADNI